MLSLAGREEALRDALGSARATADLLGDVEVPQVIAAWLGQLHALSGVPFGYLVPDEEMLPPESIRFFRVDTAWTQALIDGAFSIGRDLTANADAAAMVLDRVIAPAVHAAARAAAPRRRRANGLAAAPADPREPVVWSGFLLRSRIACDYPGLGVNAYPLGPGGRGQGALLPIVRLDRLGAGSDTLICIVDGDAAFFDIHEPPEHLHFGVDSYAPPAAPGSTPAVEKGLRSFRQAADGSVSLGTKSVQTPVGAAFRASSPRVMKVTKMAEIIAEHGDPPSVDAAQLGFEMTQGVGMVRFARTRA